MNLGTPEAPTISAVRDFLREFLHDHRVVELTRWIWCPILHGIILPFRPKKALAAYKSVWMEGGSPLKVITQQQVEALQIFFNQHDQPALVVHAMTYGQPKLSEQVHSLVAQGVERIIVLPLYPQYSATTTAAIYDQYANIIKTTRNIPEIMICKSYCDHPAYIQALAASIREHWATNPKAEKLLFSFHGIPQRCVDQGDPYYQQSLETAAATARALNLDEKEWVVSFQSRLGKARWLQPYTDKLLIQLATEGTTSVDVICPAFAADCIETLEEIQQENRHLFEAAGGKTFSYIPCLNSRDDHIALMANLTTPLFKKF